MILGNVSISTASSVISASSAITSSAATIHNQNGISITGKIILAIVMIVTIIFFPIIFKKK